MHVAHSTSKAVEGLDRTLQVLAKTQNEAAVDILVPALDSPNPTIQEGALKAILERRSPLGHRAVLERLDRAPDSWRAIMQAKKGRMTHALREAVLEPDARLCQNACKAILWFREYDLIGCLLEALEGEASPRTEAAAATLLSLADLLFEEMSAAPRDCADRRDPQLVRQRMIGSLESSVRRLGQHGQAEVSGAFLVLAQRDNVTLKQILQDPQHDTFEILTDALLHDARGGVTQLLLSFLDDPHAPASAISVISRRADSKFMHALLRKAGHPFSPIAVQNLKRVDSFGWMSSPGTTLAALDEVEQQAIVPLLVASGVRRSEVFQVIEHLVEQGTPLGRIAAGKALVHFHGPEADALVIQALSDADPQLQAAMAPQIRQRATPGGLARLLELVESPHECVRQAARASLPEFSLERFVAAMGKLDSEICRTMGDLVRKINPDAVEVLAGDLRSRSRTRRLRALEIGEAIDVVADLESVFIALLDDDDHLVRREAAVALGNCATPLAQEALRGALSDRSGSVQEAARQSLDILQQGAFPEGITARL